MAYWLGTLANINAAEAQAAAQVTGKPEFRNGVPVPSGQRVTARWADPVQVWNGWIIPVHPDVQPNNVTVIEDIPMMTDQGGFYLPTNEGDDYEIIPTMGGFRLENE